MNIDGRNYDLSLNVIPSTGISGVSTRTEFINLENAAIGGTHNGIDYPITSPELAEVIEEGYNWGVSFPETPDEILGYPETTLKTIPQPGENGSQYLYNPGKVKIGNKWFIDGLTYIVEDNFYEDDNLIKVKVTTKSKDITTVFTTYKQGNQE